MRRLLVLVPLLLLAGCVREIFPPLFGTVDVVFRATVPQPSFAAQSSPAPYDPVLVVRGSNGELRITDLRIAVRGARLESAPGACDTPGADAAAGCWVLPHGGPGVLASETGGYLGHRRIGRRSIAGLRIDFGTLAETAVDPGFLEWNLRAFPDWPAAAGIGAAGTFQPDGGAPRPFRVYLAPPPEASIRVEPALRVHPDRYHQITGGVDLAEWFLTDGAVLDLSAHHFPATGALLDLGERTARGFFAVPAERRYF